MSNAYQILGLEPRLVIADETLRDAFREAAKQAHPDAGGGEGEFAAMREAHALLASPSRRLRLWLELRGTPGELRGTVAAELMDLFAAAGAVTQLAEAQIRQREAAKSALVLAMLEGATQDCREAVERVISRLEMRIGAECAAFPEYEQTTVSEAAAQGARNLAFLEKWRAGLRATFSRLV